MASNFCITTLTTFVNHHHQIPFPHVYALINERYLKFLWQSLATRNIVQLRENLQMNLRKIIEDFIEAEGDFISGNVSG